MNKANLICTHDSRILTAKSETMKGGVESGVGGLTPGGGSQLEALPRRKCDAILAGQPCIFGSLLHVEFFLLYLEQGDLVKPVVSLDTRSSGFPFNLSAFCCMLYLASLLPVFKGCRATQHSMICTKQDDASICGAFG